MAHFIVITENTKAAKDTMNGYSGTNLVHSGGNGKYLFWEWVNAVDSHVQEVQASGRGRKPSVQPLCMISADFLG
jgi:hypothetical protein